LKIENLRIDAVLLKQLAFVGHPQHRVAYGGAGVTDANFIGCSARIRQEKKHQSEADQDRTKNRPVPNLKH
jgi:hypothetical protein